MAGCPSRWLFTQPPAASYFRCLLSHLAIFQMSTLCWGLKRRFIKTDFKYKTVSKSTSKGKDKANLNLQSSQSRESQEPDLRWKKPKHQSLNQKLFPSVCALQGCPQSKRCHFPYHPFWIFGNSLDYIPTKWRRCLLQSQFFLRIKMLLEIA